MKKFALCVCLVIALALVLRGDFYYSAALPQQVRVGLSAYQNASSIPIGNKDITAGFGAGVSLSASSGFSAVPLYSYYVRPETVYPNYESAKLVADVYASGGLNACAGMVNDGAFMVYVGAYQNEDEAAPALDKFTQATLLSPASHRTAIAENGAHILIFDNPQRNPQIKANNIKIGDRQYRGHIELVRAGGGITAVNILNTEEYLYAVVPSEMPPSWHIEALKTQAVAARTFAAGRAEANTHGDMGFHICDLEHCQMYKGLDTETESSIRAVTETAGVMIYYGGNTINAVYSSSSGGATADSEHVWANEAAYLRAVPDVYDTTGKQWERSISFDEINKLLKSNGLDIGDTISVSIGETSQYNRVNQLIITGTQDSVTIEKEEIRTFFINSSEGSLFSRMFVLGDGAAPDTPQDSAPETRVFVQGSITSGEYEIKELHAYNNGAAPTLKVEGNIKTIGADGIYSLNAEIAAALSAGGKIWTADPVIITGKGHGHGVGMSQHGAKGMAEAGFNFREILTHYYTGTEVK